MNWSRLLPALLPAIIVLSGCGTLQHKQALNDITAPALQAHMDFLSDDLLRGRMTGTTEYDIAARYVASQFREIGLEAGMGQSYLQPVPFVSGKLDIAGSALSLQGITTRKRLRFRDDFVVSADLTQPLQQISGKLVFVGHGIVAPDQNHDDYADVDVNGKIVVLFPKAPQTFPADQRAFYSSFTRKSREAADRGAIGIITIRNQYSREHYTWADSVKNAGNQPRLRWQDADGAPHDFESRIRGTATLSDELAAQIFRGSGHELAELLKMENAGDPLPHMPLTVSAKITTKTQITRLTSPNVIARLPGTDPNLATEHVVLLAHLDHLGAGAEVNGDPIYNGAYDNAMGVALMIETARTLKQTGTRRSVLFAAITGEEQGLLGSHYLARHLPPRVGQPVAALTLDMPLLLFPMQEVIGFGSEHTDLDRYVAAAAAAEGVSLAPDPLPDEVLFVRSDHYSFVREGVPGLFFFPGFNSSDPDFDGKALVFEHLAKHYHKPSDDLNRPVHWPSATRFARINARLAKLIADSPSAPRWNEGNFFAEQFVTNGTP